MKLAALGDVADIVSGATPKTGVKEYWGGRIHWATPADLSGLDGPYISTTPRTLTEAGAKSCSTTVLPANSVLLSSRAPIGHVAINTVPMATNQGFKSLVPGPDLDAKYLYHWLKSKTVHLQSLGNGATFKELSKKTTHQIVIPVPPLLEQRQIAAILDGADALRAKRRLVLTSLDSLAEASFHNMFADEAATSTVEQESSLIRTGPFGSQLRHGEFVDEGIAVLGLDNIVSSEFRWGERRFITPAKYEQLKRYTVNPGDVLISIMGTTGRCVVVPDGIPTAINTKHICAITPLPSRLHPAFLRAAFLWHPESLAHLRRQTKGSIMDGLNMGIIKAMPIPVPPLQTQEAFAKRTEQVATEQKKIMRAARADNELFASLQSRAFRGEL